MIKPSNMMITPDLHGEEGSILTLEDIPEYEEEDYDLSSSKDFHKYLTDIEKSVRMSFEYKEMIAYLRNYFEMRRTGSFENITGENSSVKIEIHHTPFSLFDIVSIVQDKRSFYHENLSVEMVAKEVMELHYKSMIGLYPLSQTEHELVHNGYLFIPTYKVFGRYDLFVDLYKQFIDEETIKGLEEIEEYSKVAFNEEQQKLLLSQSNVYLDTSGSYSLPIIDNLKQAMLKRVDQIKSNSYMLPVFEKDVLENPVDELAPKKKKDNKLKDAIIFF